jgi:hypothetical protein
MLLALAITSAEQTRSDNCRDCGEKKARLLDTCSRERIGSVTPEEAARYCQWVVRVAPASGVRQRATAAKATAEDRAIRAAIAPLEPVQPAQIESERAGVLAERPGSPAGDYAIVALTKQAGTWRVDSVTNVPRKR